MSYQSSQSDDKRDIKWIKSKLSEVQTLKLLKDLSWQSNNKLYVWIKSFVKIRCCEKKKK